MNRPRPDPSLPTACMCRSNTRSWSDGDSRPAVLDVDSDAVDCRCPNLNRGARRVTLGVGQEREQDLRGAVGAAGHLDATGHGRTDVEALGAGAGEHRRDRVMQVELAGSRMRPSSRASNRRTSATRPCESSSICIGRQQPVLGQARRRSLDAEERSARLMAELGLAHETSAIGSPVTAARSDAPHSGRTRLRIVSPGRPRTPFVSVPTPCIADTDG